MAIWEVLKAFRAFWEVTPSSPSAPRGLRGDGGLRALELPEREGRRGRGDDQRVRADALRGGEEREGVRDALAARHGGERLHLGEPAARDSTQAESLALLRFQDCDSIRAW